MTQTLPHLGFLSAHHADGGVAELDTQLRRMVGEAPSQWEALLGLSQEETFGGGLGGQGLGMVMAQAGTAKGTRKRVMRSVQEAVSSIVSTLDVEPLAVEIRRYHERTVGHLLQLRMAVANRSSHIRGGMPNVPGVSVSKIDSEIELSHVHWALTARCGEWSAAGQCKRQRPIKDPGYKNTRGGIRLSAVCVEDCKECELAEERHARWCGTMYACKQCLAAESDQPICGGVNGCGWCREDGACRADVIGACKGPSDHASAGRGPVAASSCPTAATPGQRKRGKRKKSNHKAKNK
jgi:hypothetical protein